MIGLVWIEVTMLNISQKAHQPVSQIVVVCWLVVLLSVHLWFPGFKRNWDVVSWERKGNNQLLHIIVASLWLTWLNY